MWAALGGAVVIGSGVAFAQTPGPSPPPEINSGVSFEVTPYLWLPTINSLLRYPVLGGGAATSAVSAAPGDYLPHLNFALQGAAAVRIDRFVGFTDLVYLNLADSRGQIQSLDQLGAYDTQVQRSLATHVGVSLESVIWTLAGGYNVIDRNWMTADLFAGVRLLSVNSTTDFSLSAVIGRPDRTIALRRTGSFTVSPNIWNGIAGLSGRLYLTEAGRPLPGRLFLPFYFDAGAGGSAFTWQGFGGLGYGGKAWSVSAGYRFLSFQDSGNSFIPRMNLGGAMIAASFEF